MNSMADVGDLLRTLGLPAWISPTAGIAAAIAGLIVLIALSVLLGSPRRPRYKVRALLTANEAEFFRRLCRAAPDLHFFPQVAMSGLIEPDVPSKQWRAAFGRIAQKRVDFCVCSADLRVLAIIELDDRTHDAKSDALRDSFTASAGIRTIRFQSKSKPSVEQLRSVLSQL